jgi:hypothetical protein
MVAACAMLPGSFFLLLVIDSAIVVSVLRAGHLSQPSDHPGEAAPGGHTAPARTAATTVAAHGAGQQPRPKAPTNPWATLLRVAWLAVLLGLLLQLALLLVAAGFGTFAGLRPLLAETCKTVSWSVLVCAGVALGRVASKSRLPVAGVSGLLAAPLALTAANIVQKGVAEALGATGVTSGPTPVWLLLLKAAEYAFLGAALGWIGRRAWAGASAHAAAGLVAGVIFGAAILVLTMQAAPKPLPAGGLVTKGVNELLFPIGCALVVFISEILGKRSRQ